MPEIGLLMVKIRHGNGSLSGDGSYPAGNGGSPGPGKVLPQMICPGVATVELLTRRATPTSWQTSKSSVSPPPKAVKVTWKMQVSPCVSVATTVPEPFTPGAAGAMRQETDGDGTAPVPQPAGNGEEQVRVTLTPSWSVTLAMPVSPAA